MMDLSLLWSPRGRIKRSEFWLGFVIVMALSALTSSFPGIGQLVGVVLLWPQLVIHIKRLHDIGYSGWLMLLPFSVSAVCMTLIVLNGGEALLTATPAQLPALIASAQMRKPLVFFEIAFAVEVAFLCWVGFTKGQAAANKFGPARSRER